MVHSGNLQLPTGRRLYVLGHLHNPVRVKIEPHNGIIALWMGRLLLNAQAVPLRIKLRHTVTLRITHPIPEHSGLGILLCRPNSLAEHRNKIISMENVVPKHQAGTLLPDKFFPYYEGLRQSVGRRLLCILKLNPIILPVPQEPLEPRQVVRCGNDEYLPYPRLHQHRNGIINHRFVKHRQKLFAHPLGNRIQSGAGPSGKNNSFHTLKIYSLQIISPPPLKHTIYKDNQKGEQKRF